MPDTQTQQPDQPTICDREGHEYQFGYCCDCDQQDPATADEDGAPRGIVIDNVNFGSYAELNRKAAA